MSPSTRPRRRAAISTSDSGQPWESTMMSSKPELSTLDWTAEMSGAKYELDSWGTTSPSRPELPLARARAVELAISPSRSATSMTLAVVSAPTISGLPNTREAVAKETPAWRATSARVTTVDPSCGRLSLPRYPSRSQGCLEAGDETALTASAGLAHTYASAYMHCSTHRRDDRSGMLHRSEETTVAQRQTAGEVRDADGDGGSTERKWLRFPVVARGSTYSREFVAGLSMFLATAYTVVVIPGMLSDAGLPVGAVTTSVIIVVILGTAAMGIFGNLPMVLAPGLGGVSLVAYTLVLDGDVSYPVAMGMVLWSGVIFLLLTLFGIRSLITRIIPHSIRLAIGPAIGVFIAFVGFRSAGLVRPGESSLELGELSS